MNSPYPPASSASQSVHVLAVLALSLCLMLPATSVLAETTEQPLDTWLLVDTSQLSLTVMQGETELQVFENIAIGSNGPTWAKEIYDETTPLGDFFLTVIRPSERFSLFMGIDYPNFDHTRRAFEEQRIDEAEYAVLLAALQNGGTVPQTTRLGGHLGIHGLGEGDTEIHELFNWTNGCIALTNEQIDELAGLVSVGTGVKIQ